MDNKFCNKCGQANLPNSTSCTKCGQPLGQTGGAQFAQATPPSTIPGKPPAPVKKSKTMYWVIGGLALLLVLALGLVLVAAVGIFVYQNNQSDEVVRDDQDIQRKDRDSEDDEDSDLTEDDSDDTKTKDSDNPMDDISFPDGKDVDFGDDSSGNSDIDNAALVRFFKDKKPKVGIFKLAKVVTSDDRSIFAKRLAGAEATYKSGRKVVIHRLAIYRSLDDAKGDVAAYKAAVRKIGGKIRSSKADQIIYAHKGLVYLAFYNPQGGLHELSSRNGDDILKYYKSYFKE